MAKSHYEILCIFHPLNPKPSHIAVECKRSRFASFQKLIHCLNTPKANPRSGDLEEINISRFSWRLQKIWGQDHLAKVLLGITNERHDAAGDALKSMKLWRLYNDLKTDPQRHREALVQLQILPIAFWSLIRSLGRIAMAFAYCFELQVYFEDQKFCSGSV